MNKSLHLIISTVLCFVSSLSFSQNGTFGTTGLTYLPDGSGVNYTSIVSITGFPAATISSAQDMATITVNMEHSFLGDLEMWLECPNGSQSVLFNAFSGASEAIPGGFGGNATFLGDAEDANNGTPGIGWDYSFSSSFNTFSDFPTEFGASNLVPANNGNNAMNPNGIYLPETSFDNFIGCPVDGDWTLYIRDNLGSDDGYVFGWEMNIDPSLLGHSGFVYKDLNANCSMDNLESGLENILLSIQPGNHIVQTNSFGGWFIDNLPVGTYTVTADTTSIWVPTCLPTTTFTVTDPNIFESTSPIGMESTNPCAEPNVSIAMPVSRPCMSSYVHVLVENESTASDIIPNAYVDVELDQILTIVTSSHPYTTIGTNQYRFDVGDLFPGQAESISINTFTACSAILGQTVCNSADLFPVDPCMLDTLPSNVPNDTLGVFPEPCTLPWDGSSIYVDGWCQNDSIYFSVLNTGANDMLCFTPVMVYVDSVLSYVDSLQLNGGQSQVYVYPANGQTWQIQVPQHPLHPGNSNPNAYVELCGDTNNWTPNVVNSFPLDDADPVSDVHCLQVTGSYDPNDKTGYPLGFTDEHWIDPGQQLEYLIRFQNTGTDTAFTVVIRDTLAPQLNVFTVNSGVSSHDYSFSVLDQNVLEWTFNNILLPDSTTDLEGSNGFVIFKVDQMPNLPLGSVIRNDADIYFDFNAPIITNETWHTLHVGTIQVLNVQQLSEQESKVSAYPNPAQSELHIVIDESLIGERYSIVDGVGREVLSGNLNELDSTIQLNELPQGYYLINIGGDRTNTIKVVKR